VGWESSFGGHPISWGETTAWKGRFTFFRSRFQHMKLTVCRPQGNLDVCLNGRAGMTVEKNPPIPFETALAELESLVGQLEQGELTLEDSLQRFERGVALVRSCQNTLREAEQKVEQLIERNGPLEIAPFDALAG
jgi:exodeoxyribonuclease VII small subunit